MARRRTTKRRSQAQRVAGLAVATLLLVAVVIAALGASGRATAAVSTPSITAYRGLGTWVDIYDTKVFDDPEGAVARMAARGVRTIYIETSNSNRSYGIYRPDRQRRIIRAAHARKMKVVAWYLPTLTSVSLDYGRSLAAIKLRTADGQKFDSFALDIESSAVASIAARNDRLLTLSKQIRTYTGRGYPLGAIIPSPAGLEKSGSYWKPFPFSQIARTYDVILPMAYYTYHWDGYSEVYASMLNNIRILRAKGAGERPIHMVGGIASKSSALEVRAFVKGSQDTTCVGASLYDYTTTRDSQWIELKAVKP